MACLAVPSLSLKSITKSTPTRLRTIVERSMYGMNGAPFLRLSHASELIPTTSMSPRAFAALK